MWTRSLTAAANGGDPKIPNATISRLASHVTVKYYSTKMKTELSVSLILENQLGVVKALLPPMALYAFFLHTPELWTGIVDSWRPWSDGTLFAAATVIVHTALYFGGLRLQVLMCCTPPRVLRDPT